jgi:A/G-specific adenine glycosylase
MPTIEVPPATLEKIQANLLAWFDRHRRELPWRTSRDPYRIWIAEVMLQQTRIAYVITYYEKFLARFPNFFELAQAPPREVLKLWSGLGYYSRARNLHAAAKAVIATHAGEFPRDLASALALPGIGAYTAAAVLSIAYDAPLAVLDGNVARVLARINAVEGELRAPANWSALTKASQDFLVTDRAGDWNQALMELGEVVCTPKSPACLVCPVVHECRAYALGLTTSIPAPRKQRALEQVHIAAAVLLDPQNRTLLTKDPGAHDDVLFSRMWQFPAIAATSASTAKRELAAHLRATLKFTGTLKLTPLKPVKHGVTFRDITLEPYLLRLATIPTQPRTRILPLKRFATVPVSNATRKIAKAALAATEP